jgi:hypothetical protein
MAYIAPGTVASGDVATAAAWNTVVGDILQFAPFVQGVFTNEAARDAAITSPTEGMHAYLSAPTVPAATGATTAVPTGVQTIYNGSVWVCTTMVGARTAATGSTSSTSFTTTLGGSPGTNPSVTLVTGTTALVTIGGQMAATSGTPAVMISVAVSGATTLAGADDNSYLISLGTTGGVNATSSFVLTGLTAGTNTFTLNYRVTAGTAEYLRRTITVQGIA